MEGKKKKMGRPKSDNPKRKELGVRFDDETAEMLNAYCAKHNLSKAAAIRLAIQKLVKDDEK